ncbi:hypothetical protein [Aliagarivorans taiwanensis]|uniref:hypothetical protein n=1 Tax=Aliagarivorans taiwanensis TaxID=561966 RepID=UPI0006867137|nr:hypothetical protein [Aliagarivorans taiwanensis]
MSCLKFTKHAVIACMLGIAPAASAVELPDWLGVSGFASTGAAKSNSEIPYYYSRNIQDEWCWDCDTIVGLQADIRPNDWLAASLQVVKRPVDDFSDPELEWAYLAFKPTYNVTLRGGRLRAPSFLYSQVVFVNQAFPWMRLPAEVYDTTSGFTRYEGFDADATFELTDSLLLKTQLYYGFNTKIKNNERNNILWDVDIDSIYGLRFDIESFNWLAYVRVDRSDARIESVDSFPAPPFDAFPPVFQPIVVEFETTSWAYGGYYDWDNWSLIGEATVSEEQPWNAYLSLVYRYKKWAPYVTYGMRYARGEDDLDDAQSVSLGLRYSLRSNLALIGEWHYFKVDQNRGSFTSPSSQGLAGRSASILSFGISYSFNL